MKWYRVEVSNDQGFVVAIETRGLCGRDIGPDETETIRSAIRALSGFIGTSETGSGWSEQDRLAHGIADGPMVHGVNCPKKPHTRTGYLHGEDDDTPYDVDHLKYCGRCHQAL